MVALELKGSILVVGIERVPYFLMMASRMLKISTFTAV